MTPYLPTMLFVPGADEHKLAKLPRLAAPAVIIDLEDAVAVNRKDAARRLVSNVLRDTASRPDVWVRVNGMRTSFVIDDLRAILHPSLKGVVLPKAGDAGDLVRLESMLRLLEAERGLDDPVQIMPIIESIEGLRNVDAICRASERISRLAFGAGDFSTELGLNWPLSNGTVSPIITEAKCQIVLASKHAGLPAPHDGAFPFIDDEDRLRAEAEAARDIGMAGKHAIHPSQVSAITEIFTPSDEDIAWAEGVVRAFGASEASGVANLSHNGELVDYPVFRRAEQILDGRR